MVGQFAVSHGATFHMAPRPNMQLIGRHWGLGCRNNLACLPGLVLPRILAVIKDNGIEFRILGAIEVIRIGLVRQQVPAHVL